MVGVIERTEGNSGRQEDTLEGVSFEGWEGEGHIVGDQRAVERRAVDGVTVVVIIRVPVTLEPGLDMAAGGELLAKRARQRRMSHQNQQQQEQRTPGA